MVLAEDKWLKTRGINASPLISRLEKFSLCSLKQGERKRSKVYDEWYKEIQTKMSSCLRWIFLAVVITALSADVASAEHMCTTKDDGVIPVKVFSFDFDKTATPFRAKLAEQLLYKATSEYRNGDRAAKEKLDSKWKKLFSYFRRRFHELTVETLNNVTHSNKLGITKAEKELQMYLMKMDQIRKESVEQMLNNKLLVGLATNDIRSIARQIALSPGLIKTLRRLRGKPFNVITAGLSKRLIQAVFNSHNAPANLVVHAGEISFEGGVSTGQINHKPLTPFDKARVLRQLINEAVDTKGYVIYVGDNYLDLLALLKADIGILIHYTKMTIDLVHAFGIETLPLEAWWKRKGCRDDEDDTDPKPVIFTTQSWDEIGQFVFGFIV